MFVWDKCGYFEFSNINFNKNKIVSYLVLEICDYYSFILRILFWDSIKYILILSNRMEKPLQSKGKKTWWPLTPEKNIDFVQFDI